MIFGFGPLYRQTLKLYKSNKDIAIRIDGFHSDLLVGAKASTKADSDAASSIDLPQSAINCGDRRA
jgi:hypothetical protein